MRPAAPHLENQRYELSGLTVQVLRRPMSNVSSPPEQRLRACPVVRPC